jgi:hypothetical protein
MRPQSNLSKSLATRKPGRNTPRPIARELRLAAIRIEQPQKKLAIRSPLQELNPIRANTGIPRTQLPRQLQVLPPRELLFKY